jgi:hypothetical protein
MSTLNFCQKRIGLILILVILTVSVLATVPAQAAYVWKPLGSGMNGYVYALEVYGTNICAGGDFTGAGEVSANYVAKWDGTAWSALGKGMNGYIWSLAADSSGNLYAGGKFTTAGGVSASYIAKWNGTAWSAIGSGMNGAVNALAFDSSGNLYAGGNFTTAGRGSANYIAKWDGTAWNALGSGMDGAVNALVFDNSGNLYAGGAFTTADGGSANYIAKWDGTAWSAVGSEINSYVYSLVFDNSGNLYAGGKFTTADGIAANIAKWGGSSWRALGSGTDSTVYTLAFGSGNLYAGGEFITADGISASRIARWDGSSWSTIGSGIGGTVYDLTLDSSGNLYAGGNFTTGGRVSAYYIAVYTNNTPPVAVSDKYRTTQNTALNISASDLLSDDRESDRGDTLTVVILTDPVNGKLTADPDTSFIYTPNTDFVGTDSFTYKANDGYEDSAAATVEITVYAANQSPSFTKGADQTVKEDAGAQTISGWATDISAGPDNESAQILTFNVTNNNNALFSIQPGISADGTLTYSPAANAAGSATLTVTLKDDGGTEGGGVDTSDAQTFMITVSAINDAPSFAKGPDQTVNENAGAQTVTKWATDISKGGGSDEALQTLTFSVINDNNALFSVQPAIDAAGTLTYKPAADANGSATVTVILKDSGGTANSGIDTSPSRTFKITVSPVSDALVITGQKTLSINEDKPLIIFLTDLIVTGTDTYPEGFSLTVLTGKNYTVSGNTISPNADFKGTLSVPVFATEGSESSNTYHLTITVKPVNDPPSFVKGEDQTVDEDAGSQSISGWASSVSKGGGTDESSQTLAFKLTNDNNALFSVQPAIDAAGTLTYTPAADANGLATVTVKLSDSGGTENGGVDTSASQTFKITVSPVNDAPVITGPEFLSTDMGKPLTILLENLSVSDADNIYPTGFSLSVQSGENYTVSGNTITPSEYYKGMLTVPISVSDGLAESNIFNLTVTVGDEPPTVAEPIADVTVDEDAPDSLIDLSAVFSDPDSDASAIIKTVASNSNPSLLSAEVAENTLTLKYLPDQYGDTVITVKGSAYGKSAETSFTVTVNPVDDAPRLVSEAGIPAVEAMIGDSPKTLNLTEFFTDIDNDVSEMTFSATSSNSLVGAAVSGNILTLTFPADTTGDAVITVTASSGGKTVSHEFSVTVGPKTYGISGKIAYFSNGLGISGVKIILEGLNSAGEAEIYTAETDSDGAYLFSDILPGDYTLSPEKNEAPNPENLSAEDAYEIAAAVVGITPLTDIQHKAADVNGNNRVTGLDASNLARFAAGLISEMSDTDKPAPGWQFEPELLAISLSSDMDAQNFSAGLTGDVSGNYTPGIRKKTARENSPSLLPLVPGDILSVPLVLTQETDIRSIDIRITYDPDMLVLSELSRERGVFEGESYQFVVNTNEPGVIHMIIYADSLPVSTQGTLITANFIVSGSKPVSVLKLERFDCNEIPVFVPECRTERIASEITGGFYFGGTVFREALIRNDGGQNLLDIDGSGKIGLEDALRALQETNLEGAVRVLQCLTGM